MGISQKIIDVGNKKVKWGYALYMEIVLQMADIPERIILYTYTIYTYTVIVYE